MNDVDGRLKELNENGIMTKDVVSNDYEINVYRGISLALCARDYTLYEAISELIDNCIAATYIDPETKKPTKLEVDIEINKDVIRLRDSGHGQDSIGLARAMDYGRPSNIANSRFGVGLKQAVPSIGDYIEFRTKKFGDERIHIYQLNMEEMRKTPHLLLKDVKTRIDSFIPQFDYDINDHFFEITIKKLRDSPTKYMIKKLKEHLSIYFGSYIRNGQLSISVNTTTLQPNKLPGLVCSKEFPDGKRHFDLNTEGCEGMTGWWGIVKPDVSERSKNFGFETYFDGGSGPRLVTMADLSILGQDLHETEKLASLKHPNYYRLIGQLFSKSPSCFDECLTSSKNQWTKNSRIYKTVALKVREIVIPEFDKILHEQKQEIKKDDRYRLTKGAEVATAKFLRDSFPELRQKRNTGSRRATDDEEPDGDEIF